MYIAPGQGLTTPWGRNLDVNKNILSLRLFVASFKIFSLKSDFIHFFSFYTCIQPQGRGSQPSGGKVSMSTEMSCHFICCKFKKMSLKSDFIQFFFHDLIHVYSPGAGAYSPWGQSFDVICC